MGDAGAPWEAWFTGGEVGSGDSEGKGGLHIPHRGSLCPESKRLRHRPQARIFIVAAGAPLEKRPSLVPSDMVTEEGYDPWVPRDSG